MQRFGKPAQRKAPPRVHKLDNARNVALNVLQDITRQDAYASIALSTRLRDARLDPRDRDLVTELVYGTLENQIALDYLLNRRVERPNTDPIVRDILRMGAYQIVYLTRIPDRAAVDESVKLARVLDREPFVGFINGVLRGLSRDSEAGNIGMPGRDVGLIPYLSITHSMPEWIVGRLVEVYGEADAEAIIAFRENAHTQSVRLTPGTMEPEAFERLMDSRGWKHQPGLLPGTYNVSGIGDVGIERAYLDGTYSIQGISSQLAAMALSPRRAGNILDACAAPGGKTACIAAQMDGTGRVYAWDKHEHRVELIRSMVKRLRLYSVRPAVRDATILREDMRMTMDAVLIDAPCSGLGVMLSKPDAKYRQTEEGIASLVETQRALLDTCSQYVKPGGSLVYSTCTLLPEENEKQVQRFLAEHKAFEADEAGLRAVMPDFVQDRIDGCMMQLLAHRDGVEGFFIARMKRKR